MTNTQIFAKYELTTELVNGRFIHTSVIEIKDVAIPTHKNTLNLDLAGIAEAQAQADKIRRDLIS